MRVVGGQLRLIGWLAGLACLTAVPVARAEKANDHPELLHVDPTKGRDRNPGSKSRPLKDISAAIALLPETLERSVTIQLAQGTYAETGGNGMPKNVLHLMRRMRPGVSVRIVGAPGAEGDATVLAWEGGSSMIAATDGDWSLEGIRIGSFSQRQRRGVVVEGPAHVTLKDVSFRMRSQSDAGIVARRFGRVSLLGRIRINEQLHDEAGEGTFCGIIATDHGTVKFEQREGASLDIGNGSLSASYYGCIKCETGKHKTTGASGADGASGTAGAPGIAGSAAGSLKSGRFSPLMSGGGGAGGHGSGGGGGGAAGGVEVHGCLQQSGRDDIGGSGGGGGSGGCGGGGGSGGQGGGGSFAVWVIAAQSGIPTAQGLRLRGGSGGAGGQGGAGGLGGYGGFGGKGGLSAAGAGKTFCTSKGGSGGSGGNGGHGGGGAGGAGGPAWPLVGVGMSQASLDLFAKGVLIEQIGSGSGGSGGSGGSSAGKAGAQGPAGEAKAVRRF